MKVLVFSLTCFALAFIIQLVFWKIYMPQRQIKTLLLLFFCILVVEMFVLWSAPSSFTFVRLSAPGSIWEYLHICMFFVSLLLAYMITYTALEADSPSLVMVMTIGSAGPEGLDKKKFDRLMSDDTLIVPRIEDLVLDKMVYMDGDKYRLTPKGVLMARIFVFYRKLLGAPKGG